MTIQGVIGDYVEFFAGLRLSLTNVGIDVTSYSISHLCYRVTNTAEYEAKRDGLKSFCRAFVENEFNGRPVSMLLLKSPLTLSKTHAASLIELPSPRAAHTYPPGLEHVGFVVRDTLTEFNERFRDVLSGVKDRGPECRPSFVTFADGKTAKFYDRPLMDIIERDGWRMRGL